ncbi:hypothetical protein D9M69_562690 [compost metagenome]
MITVSQGLPSGRLRSLSTKIISTSVWSICTHSSGRETIFFPGLASCFWLAASAPCFFLYNSLSSRIFILFLTAVIEGIGRPPLMHFASTLRHTTAMEAELPLYSSSILSSMHLSTISLSFNEFFETPLGYLKSE